MVIGGGASYCFKAGSSGVGTGVRLIVGEPDGLAAAVCSTALLFIPVVLSASSSLELQAARDVRNKIEINGASNLLDIDIIFVDITCLS
tara:strand:- start:208 stop:474 length:267 start_codon:yes stop_codon:yes gene_type:complete